jgi:hypothetical protein
VTLLFFSSSLIKNPGSNFSFLSCKEDFSLDTGEGKKYDVNGFILGNENGNFLTIAQKNQWVLGRRNMTGKREISYGVCLCNPAPEP